MTPKGTLTIRPRASLLLAATVLSLLFVSVTPLAAQATMIPVTGVLTDAAQAPVAGFRVVFLAVGTNDVFLSAPTDDEGAYRIDIPQGTNCSPVAVISPEGKRLALGEMTTQPVLPGARWEIELTIVIKPIRDPRPFQGADRLFLSFVEDAVFVERQRAEADLIGASFSDRSTWVSQLVGAVNFTALPRLEFGGRLGYAGTDFDAGGGATGLTDLEAWGKFYVGSSLRSATRWAAGFVLTFPTGEVDTGLSADALRSLLFGAVRLELGKVTFSANAGLRVNENAEIAGVELDGRVAARVGAAALAPLGDKLVLVGELTYEGERFDGGEADARLLVGVNWKPLREGFFRLALAGGLTEGAPDAQINLGYAFDF